MKLILVIKKHLNMIQGIRNRNKIIKTNSLLFNNLNRNYMMS